MIKSRSTMKAAAVFLMSDGLPSNLQESSFCTYGVQQLSTTLGVMYDLVKQQTLAASVIAKAGPGMHTGAYKIRSTDTGIRRK